MLTSKIFKYIFLFLNIILIYNISFSCASNEKKSNQKQQAQEFSEEERVIGEYIVTVKEGIDEQFLYELFSENSVSLVKNIHNNIYLIKIEDDPGPTEIERVYLKNNNIDKIQPNYEYEIKSSKGGKTKIKR